ncbi:hypothetical protein FOH24_07120 [Acetobacter tropicalis]|uniref:Uncharacterized protein n=2 Tax=Acetobacter tropicalis TaxID=104102 RepID=A0A094YIH5_9PROT|nr:hypothetical protein [Acetobacter tropicalis]KAA8391403.1 hypothetical protein FOH24_07120 [Acetobacter tropicalis]KGB21147.1 hypothetical protein AtDm6_3142 [Acetobacter tropicalis]
MAQKNACFYLVSQSAIGGIAVNISTFVLVLATVGIGVWLDSSPMEWVGAMMFWMVLIARANKTKSSKKAFDDPQELADYLLDKYGVSANPLRAE